MLLVGVILRIGLAALFPSLPQFLSAQVELSTPVSSFSRLQEGVYLYKHLSSPYQGNVFFQSPLLLSLFSVLPVQNSFYVSVFYALVDGWTAYNLAKIAKARPITSFSPNTIALLYLMNPFSMLGGLARSTLIFTNWAIVASVQAAIAARPIKSVVLIALASCLSLYPLYLVLPIFSLCLQNSYRYSFRSMVLALIGSIGAFSALGYLPLQSWNFLDKQYLTSLLFRDLSQPNLGVWWYYFIEMFAPFRPFFVGVFQLFLGSFPVGLTIRFPHEPLFVISAVVGLLAIFKPYPEVADIGLFLTLLALNKRVVGLMRYRLVVILGLLYVSALAPTFYNLWVYRGSGNANFFYAITLVYTLTVALALSDAIWAAVRLDYDGGRGRNLMQL
ncbi:GPI transamidase component GAB1 [Wickerhamiella sorbophila]|uniref:GPI transamidase component GAB1 n=1 Tax=Wickerhamiella sorbophila TaxID=45607 RepID=A0A2T0FEG0_9ASCO|nr:GPI transamidase component GAB1 [Wickerhamiella sorbophila]PRT53388.1 GPI transamidase component GAB1 [Wickerhamiella sorbophila]